MIMMLIAVAVALVVAHELAHVVTTLALGGRFEGVVVKHVLAVGVKIRVDGLSARQIMLTLLAAPVAELGVTITASVLAPSARSLWLLLIMVQWGANWVPWWGFPNDGWRLWQLVRDGVSVERDRPVA